MKRFALLVTLISAFVTGPFALGRVRVASPFTDHMVVQQGKPLPVWGEAKAGEKVTLTIAAQTRSTTADSEGKWRFDLDALDAGGPHQLVIAGSNGSRDDTLTLSDVLVGEVWLCSGQSNMDFTVAKTPKYRFAGVKDEANEVAAANYPQIRMFTGEWSKAYTPQKTISGEWKVCTPENVREFSAVGYFFARDLQKELKVPVGIVTLTFGASTAESWIRREALEPIAPFKPQLEKFDAAVHAYGDEGRTKYAADLKKWQATTMASAATSPSTRPARPPRNPDPVLDQHNPTVMFNGMIAPVIPYAIRGFLWYQGESIVGGRDGIKLYPTIQSALVKDWRTLWHDDSLPFYIVQLAALKAGSNSPDVRAAQATILDLPHTGMAVTIDIGDASNVHPKNKQDVGERLCRIALAQTYGKAVEYAGPVAQAATVEGNSLRLKFSHAAGGLIARDSERGELRTFAIAGADRKFVPATARIDGGDSVLVSSPEIPAPTMARYAWENYPEGCNLYNKSDLPAAPFEITSPTVHR